MGLNIEIKESIYRYIRCGCAWTLLAFIFFSPHVAGLRLSLPLKFDSLRHSWRPQSAKSSSSFPSPRCSSAGLISHIFIFPLIWRLAHLFPLLLLLIFNFDWTHAVVGHKMATSDTHSRATCVCVVVLDTA